jgi:hypothetical protein
MVAFHYVADPDLDAAIPECLAAAVDFADVERGYSVMTEHAGKIWEDQNWQMDVTDNVGLILFVLHVSAMRSPAASGKINPKHPAR